MDDNTPIPTEPVRGWSTGARVLRVLDGDTIEVEITRIVQVRLRGDWAPESRTTNKKEKAAGLKAKARMMELLPVGTEVTVLIPTSIKGKIQDVISMSRLLGHCWVKGLNVAVQMVKEGLAFPTKEAAMEVFPRGGGMKAIRSKKT